MGSPTVRIKGFLKSKKRSAGGEFCGSRFCPETCCTVVCHLVHVCHTHNHPLILTLMLHNSLWHHTYLISLQSLALNKISSCGLTWALFSFQPCARFLSFYPCSPLSLYESQQLLCLAAPTPSQTSPGRNVSKPVDLGFFGGRSLGPNPINGDQHQLFSNAAPSILLQNFTAFYH